MVAASFRIRSKNDLLRHQIYLIHLSSDGMPEAICLFSTIIMMAIILYCIG